MIQSYRSIMDAVLLLNHARAAVRAEYNIQSPAVLILWSASEYLMSQANVVMRGECANPAQGMER